MPVYFVSILALFNSPSQLQHSLNFNYKSSANIAAPKETLSTSIEGDLCESLSMAHVTDTNSKSDKDDHQRFIRQYEEVAKYVLQREDYEFGSHSMSPKDSRKIEAELHRRKIRIPEGDGWFRLVPVEERAERTLRISHLRFPFLITKFRLE